MAIANTSLQAIGDSTINSGQATAPVAGTFIAGDSQTALGEYTATVVVGKAGTDDALYTNLRLQINTRTFLLPSPVGSVQLIIPRFSIRSTDAGAAAGISINANAGAGCIYFATLIVTRLA